MDLAKNLFYAQRALETLFSATNKLQMKGDQYLQEITIRQVLAVAAIIHAPDGKATINHIAKQLGTTKQSAKHIVNAMEKKQYLSIAPSEQDKRAVNITITVEGEKVFKVCSERTDEFLADIFQNFTTEELEIFCMLIQKLYRFDGIEQDIPELHQNYNESEAEEILHYHQNFIKRKTQNQKKENQL